MTIDEIKVILQNRVITLTEARKSAVSTGDLQKVIEIDGDLLTTINSIETLIKAVNGDVA